MSLVVTSPLTIEEPKTGVREAIALVLPNLAAIAADATSIDVRVSGVLSAADLAARDPAMRSLRG